MLNVADKNLISVIRVGGTTETSSRGRPEIDRARLRLILVKSLPEGSIRWNCRLRSMDADDLSRYFDHGVETEFDLLIGEDGSWRKVRPVLTDVELHIVGFGGSSSSSMTPKKTTQTSTSSSIVALFSYTLIARVSLLSREEVALSLYTRQARGRRIGKSHANTIHTMQPR